MILTDIIAENFLKYARLELRNLPAQGVIAVSGANESGKSSIGEVICFALFGRTFSLGQEDLRKLIRWGEPACSVTVRFRVEDQAPYQITRMLDRNGNHGVRLSRADAEESPFARGQVEVEAVLYDLLGYGYDEFIESYYLAQREIIAPQPHSQAVKSMAGLATLEYVAYEHEQEIEQEREAIAGLQDRIEQQDGELRELNLDPAALGELESEQQALQANQALLQEKGANLERAFGDYREMLPKRFAARRARRRASILRLFSLIATLLSGVAWGMLARLPDHPYSGRIDSALKSYLTQWEAQYPTGLLYAAALFALLFALLWVRVVTRQMRVNRLNGEANGLAVALESALLSPANGLNGVHAEEGEADERAALPARILAETVSISELEPAVERIVDTLQEKRETLRQRGVRLGTALHKEQARLKQGAQLDAVREALQQQRAEHERRIELREHALELLSGAMNTLSQRFNRDLGESVSGTLPIFTDNNYQHLQIEDDLTVRVFSSQKRDFMDLEEISSGTQRQIMLALRLALAQALNRRTEGGRQFVFLDEPFAFFDQERTRSTLRALPGLNGRISQTWIVAQDFPAGEAFDLSLTCDRERPELVV
ncbi:AAA family ATPase [Sedimenticola hydrogenitrophicus]|uniref:AAA family ATPase n=1 Tax=Sedimenticola hydrogenitrophicus TaxID=2967975 RepID=UPI0021A56EB1|nr:AAA family ATPase [Sedimenticola hydrogenitrophicus]